MKKALFYLFLFIVIVILVVFFSWNHLPTWISNKLSAKTKVKVSIEKIGLSRDTLAIDKIYVGNPPGYTKTPRALSVRTLDANVPLTRFLDKDIVIDKMNMDKIYLGLEFDSKGSKKGNWTTIMRNLKKSNAADRKKEKKSEAKTVLIKRLYLTDITAVLAYKSGEKGRTIKVKQLELKNISSEGGIPTAQLMDIIISEFLKDLFSKEGIQNMLDGVIPGGSSNGGGFQHPIKKLFSAATGEN